MDPKIVKKNSRLTQLMNFKLCTILNRVEKSLFPPCPAQVVNPLWHRVSKPQKLPPCFLLSRHHGQHIDHHGTTVLMFK